MSILSPIQAAFRSTPPKPAETPLITSNPPKFSEKLGGREALLIEINADPTRLENTPELVEQVLRTLETKAFQEHGALLQACEKALASFHAEAREEFFQLARHDTIQLPVPGRGREAIQPILKRMRSSVESTQIKEYEQLNITQDTERSAIQQQFLEKRQTILNSKLTNKDSRSIEEQFQCLVKDHQAKPIEQNPPKPLVATPSLPLSFDEKTETAKSSRGFDDITNKIFEELLTAEILAVREEKKRGKDKPTVTVMPSTTSNIRKFLVQHRTAISNIRKFLVQHRTAIAAGVAALGTLGAAFAGLKYLANIGQAAAAAKK